MKISQPIVRITEPQIYVRHEAAGLLVGGYGFQPLSFDMDEFPADFEIPALPADPLYYEQLATAASRYFPSLREAVIIQERRGLPTMAPDGRMIASESEQMPGLIVLSACTVGGIQRSPGAGRIAAEIVSGKPPWIPPSQLSVDRFDDHYSDDEGLRARLRGNLRPSLSRDSLRETHSTWPAGSALDRPVRRRLGVAFTILCENIDVIGVLV